MIGAITLTKIYQFEAVITKQIGINAAYVEFPFDVHKEFGTKGQIKVVASFDGFEYRGSLATMGHHCHIIGITQKIRSAIEKNAGDIIQVIIKQDTELRTVEIPEDLRSLLDLRPEAITLFENLSFTNKKKYIQWITSAKKIETRERRLREAIEKLMGEI